MLTAMGRHLHKQAGVALIVEIVVLAMVISATAFIGYRVYQIKTENTIVSGPSSSSNSAVPYVDCGYEDKELCKFLDHHRNVSDFSIKATQVIGQQSSEIFMEIDRNEAALRLEIKAGGQPFNEILIIKDTYYVHKPQAGNWVRYVNRDYQEGKYLDSFFYDKNEADPTKRVTFEFASEESCEQGTCRKYRVNNPQQPTKRILVTFDTKQYRIRQLEVQDAKGNKADVAFSYNSVSLKPPTPVVDGNQNDAIFDVFAGIKFN